MRGRIAPDPRRGAESDYLVRRVLQILAVMLAGALVGCGASDGPGRDEGLEGTAEDDYLLQTLITGLPGPTQMAGIPTAGC